jgi:hypothetical protein
MKSNIHNVLYEHISMFITYYMNIFLYFFVISNESLHRMFLVLCRILVCKCGPTERERPVHDRISFELWHEDVVILSSLRSSQ